MLARGDTEPGGESAASLEGVHVGDSAEQCGGDGRADAGDVEQSLGDGIFPGEADEQLIEVFELVAVFADLGDELGEGELKEIWELIDVLMQPRGDGRRA